MNIQGINGAGGQVNQARVNVEGQLLTRTIAASEQEHSIVEGDGFQVYTGVMTLTTAVKQSVLYIKNNDINDIILTAVTIGSGASTGGANNIILAESVGNVATTDAIVTLGTDLTAFNANGGSARSFVGEVKAGPQATSVNGVAISGVLSDRTTGEPIELSTIVPKGGAASLEVTPPAGNTSMDITVTLSFHVVES